MTSETDPAAALADGVGGFDAFVSGFAAEDDALLGARARAEELGCGAVSPATGAALALLATTVQARAVVEIGTGTGVSGLHLLRGMAPDGILTTIDWEPEFHRSARRVFGAAGYPPGRVRTITGRALDVLSRLTSGGYDLVFADATLVEYPGYFAQGVQLLRPGGVIVFHNVLADGRIGDHAQRDPRLLALRDVARAMRDDDRLHPAVLPLGGGLLAGAVAPEPA
ncbi:methyltransferase [Saccharomonospora sp. CUA-673]|uniref:O-methyltransferase n=1 Tax=Saccharomonospora sp. CUA-673 TaxID=1904969 RepID=UPI00095E225D|nr:class I SAM-dependent methyltransferase [Saccharomonospora sp. CUA-673]OLT48217.1 methyltransferase [Saccharomonospora sp. CUA-673]